MPAMTSAARKRVNSLSKSTFATPNLTTSNVHKKLPTSQENSSKAQTPIVCSGQTIVCREQTMVWWEQTIVWPEQTTGPQDETRQKRKVFTQNGDDKSLIFNL
jgi:hypothetical protein